MKARHISIKSKIFITFITFAIVLLGVLWFFQIIYLTDFYKFVKRTETEIVLNEIEVLLEEGGDCTANIEALAASSNTAIFITDSKGNPIYNAEYIVNSRMSSLPSKLFQMFYKKALDNDGKTVIEYKGSEMQKMETTNRIKRMPYDGLIGPLPKEQAEDKKASQENGPQTDKDSETEPDVDKEEPKEPDDSGKKDEDNHGHLSYTIPKDEVKVEEQFRQNIGNELAESVIYIRIFDTEDFEYVIMVNSVLTPLDATVSTLKSQLLLISIIMILIAVISAIVLSKSISKSIIKTNEVARQLAEGHYDVTFDSHDYKEIAQLSDTLNFAATELGKADALQKELIANISHDLRTPLTMITGYSEVMRDIPGENTPENVQVIIDETERLTGLVNDMLDISKLKAGTIELSPTEYNFTESIRFVLARYNKLREVDGYKIDFEYDRETMIIADESKMHQVLYNLINNAINYTGEDKQVKVVQKVADNIIRIEVTDTGNGVKPEDIPYVWDRYYKDKSNHVRAKTGTGLGLAIVKSVLELHGAKYGVSSILGHGATFWFEIAINPFDEE